jgi:hypothetical protein
MKLLYLLLNLLCSDKIIKNADLPSCKNCIYYELKNDDAYSNLNKCTKFGTKNIINDKINYEYADFCRNDESKCGLEGKYFVEEPNVSMKMLKYKLSNDISSIMLLVTLIILSYEIILISKK